MKQLATVAGILGVFLAVSGAAIGGDKFVFVADLSGTQEVLGAPPFLAPQPGVATATTGRFRISFDPALTAAQFRLRVDQGFNITQAHLHCAPAGVNGPIVVFLFGLVPPLALMSVGSCPRAS